MKYKNLKILQIVSSSILIAIIILVLSAYFKMDDYFSASELKEHSTEFHLFVWGIILLSTGSFFISWRLILTANATMADKKDNLSDEIIDNDQQHTQVKNYDFDVNTLFIDKKIDYTSAEFIENTITRLCRELELDLAVSFKLNDENIFENWINYALYAENKPESFNIGDGLHGQAAFEKRAIHIKDIPENYLKITSGSGHILPKNIFIIPIVKDDKTIMIIEFADMKSIENNSFDILQNFAKEFSIVLKG